MFTPVQNLAIDLGNNNTLLTDQSSLLLSQPSCLVVNESTNKVEAVGDKAFEMLEKTHHHLKSVKPLKGGVICDGVWAKKMLREMVYAVSKQTLFNRGFNYLLSGIPFDTTSVEKRALRDALDQFSSRKTLLMYEPLAAAMGMGLNIQEAEGKMIVDIGGGITEVVVISLSGIAAFQSTKVAGDYLDESIRDYFRKECNLAIGLRTAEHLKIKLGCVYQPMANSKNEMSVTGKDLMEGIPRKIFVSETELCRVLEPAIQQIEHAIHQTLETCPPELAADIYMTGIHLTGGNSLLKGISERFAKKFQLPIIQDDNPLLSVSKGISKVLKAPEKSKSVLF